MTTREKVIRACLEDMKAYHIDVTQYSVKHAIEITRDSWVASGTSERLFYTVWEIHFEDKDQNRIKFDNIYVDKYGRVEQSTMELG